MENSINSKNIFLKGNYTDKATCRVACIKLTEWEFGVLPTELNRKNVYLLMSKFYRRSKIHIDIPKLSVTEIFCTTDWRKANNQLPIFYVQMIVKLPVWWWWYVRLRHLRTGVKASNQKGPLWKVSKTNIPRK